MVELLPFQIDASTQIADRFRVYMEDPLAVTRTRIVPFYQNLSSITGSGKTLILADSIEQIRSILPIEPIVLWLSKGKVVVWQTYYNLSSGKYSSLLGGYDVKPLLDCKPVDIERTDKGLVLVATVGKFNQRDKEQGDRKIFQVELDSADQSLWDQMKIRRDSNGRRRSLIVVYDEGHNLSNQQTELLLELEPDALIVASATTRIPETLSRIIDRLKQDKNWSDSDFVTSVKSSVVVESGLIKRNIMLGGYVTPMEIAINDMLNEMEKVEQHTHELGLPFTPKAIYVSNTNVVAGLVKDNVERPFSERTARPILIWRHLVETRGIDPNEIAVYCNLNFSPKYPAPKNFVLFSGGESDYDTFMQGNYKHIIFNLTLQEGWDDPSVYFAYIDKDMGSKDQITQVIGRVLRQPGGEHYPYQELNTAHFYIRTDEKSVFEQVLSEVETKLSTDTPEITLNVRKIGSSDQKTTFPVKKERFVPEVSINSAHAKAPIKKIIQQIHDYRNDKDNTVGKGGRIQVLQTIGTGRDQTEEWVEVEHSNRVTARWVFVREIQKYYGKAVNLCDIEDPKFDAMIEYHSRAAEHIREAARKVVRAYIDYSSVIQNDFSSYKVSDIQYNPSEVTRFKNALHEGYSGLNKLEKKFATAIDSTKRVWLRNPSRGFFEIPLLDMGGTKNFNPDFLVWVDNSIVSIDTKGDHLIIADAGRKLFHIDKFGNGPDIKIRLVTEGEWNENITKDNNNGYTVWILRNGKAYPIHCKDVNEAVRLCLASDPNSQSMSTVAESHGEYM
ncbi:DEAD/DEAH box helicase family protein [Brevibacillus agri]